MQHHFAWRGGPRLRVRLQRWPHGATTPGVVVPWVNLRLMTMGIGGAPVSSPTRELVTRGGTDPMIFATSVVDSTENAGALVDALLPMAHELQVPSLV